jgi:hypothetical protein
VSAPTPARCQALGLLLGRRMHVSSYGLFGYTLLSSATLGDALQLALEYPALLGTYFQLSLHREGDRVWLQADGYRDLPELEQGEERRLKRIAPLTPSGLARRLSLPAAA